MFTAEQLLEATAGRLVSGHVDQIVSGVSTDSRTISQGDLFIALVGNNFDGHNYINDCAARGAAGIITQKDGLSGISILESKARPFIIKVKDTTKALGDIAHFHRQRFDIPVIAITGSNGKTTTKDMIAHILSGKYKVLKNQGTFNNLIGVPLTIFKLNKEHQACVLEMGANHTGEISRLVDIAGPNMGVILNVGPSHLEFFNDLETVSRAKMELFKNFTGDNLAIWNADDAMLSSLYQTLSSRKKTFGFSSDYDFYAANIENTENGWRFMLNGLSPVNINLLGRHNVYNALAAICVADELGIEYPAIYDAFDNFSAPSMRMEILQAGDITIINDCYNSNPKSMESAVSVLSNFKASGRRILVSGDMLELGEISSYLHNQVGRNVAESGIDIFIGVGRMSKEATIAAIRAGMNPDAVLFCDNSDQAGKLLLKIVRPQDVVLIKGSRGMKMEKVCSTIYSTH